MARALESVDFVFHLAGQTSVQFSLEHPQEDFDINVNGTLNLLEAIRYQPSPLQGFIFVSSSAVYGDTDVPLSENSVLKPTSPYAAGKLAAERLVQAYDDSYEIPTAIVRLFNVYGPGQLQRTSVIPQFISAILKNRPPSLYGKGGQSRDFIHVKDAVHCLKLLAHALQRKTLQNRTFNLVTGKETRILDLWQLIVRQAQACGYAIPLTLYAPFRRGEIFSSLADIHLICRELSFSADIPLEKGIQDLVQMELGIAPESGYEHSFVSSVR